MKNTTPDRHTLYMPPFPCPQSFTLGYSSPSKWSSLNIHFDEYRATNAFATPLLQAYFSFVASLLASTKEMAKIRKRNVPSGHVRFISVRCTCSSQQSGVHLRPNSRAYSLYTLSLF